MNFLQYISEYGLHLAGNTGGKAIILIILLFTNLILISSVLSCGIFYRFYRTYKHKKIEEYGDIFENILNEYLFTDEDKAGIRLSLKRICGKSRLAKDVLIKSILDLHKNFTGDFSDSLRHLYFEMELDKTSVAKLSEKSWYLKVKGLREITEMKVYDAAGKVVRLTDSGNYEVRSSAQVAALTLQGFSALSFLGFTGKVITDWQQMCFLKILTGFESKTIPDFSKWLGSTNDSVVIFSIKLISYYNQINSSFILYGLLSHPNIVIRILAVKALGELTDTNCKKLLIDEYGKQPREVKIEILKTLAKLAGNEEIDFLKSQIISEDYDISLNAAKSLIANGEMGLKNLDIILKSASEFNKSIIRHSLDPLI